MITFTCKGKGCSPRQWEGSLEILQRGNPCEAELCARGSRFHLIVGKHSYGNYLCEYSCVGVPLFRRNGYRQSGGRKPLFRNRDTALN